MWPNMYIILKMNIKALSLTFLVSLSIHIAILALGINFVAIPEVHDHQFKIRQLRLFGSKTAQKHNLFSMPNIKRHQEHEVKKPTLKQLSFNEPIVNKYAKKALDNSKKKFQKISMKKYLKDAPSQVQSAKQVLDEFSELSDLDIKFELPKGVPEDELNPRELVFYSFQKRTIQAYINSFIKELNHLSAKERANGVLLTNKKQTLAGRLTYDKNGDIVKIKTLAWSDEDKVQDFFLKILKNINSLPNPPKEIIENDQFAINFILNLNQ